MSGGNSKNKSKNRASGWEEAGGEFYQELYPGGEQDVFEHLQRADTATLHTLLPSKHARTSTTVKRARSHNERRQSTFARTTHSRDVNLSMLPDLSATTVKRARSHNERRQSTFARTTHSRDVNLSMLPDLSENLSNEERTWDEIMQIKAMPLPMHQKREIKARLQNATKLRLQGFEQLHWRQRKVWHRFRIRFTEVLGKLELWQSSLRDIEGKFGIGVVSFFIFLRWLLFLNIGISLLILLFLVLPKTILTEETHDCDNYELNSTVCCSEYYFDRNQTDTNVFLDALQGTGWMERTILFYGVYSNQIYKYNLINLFKSDMYFNMPLAYILVPISWAFLSLIAIVKSAAKGFKERLVESEGQFYMYCNLVFGGWDFCIHNEKSAKIKHKALYNEIKCCLEEERYKEEIQLRTKESQIFLFLKRFFMNIVVFAILFASGLLIYFVFNYSSDKLTEENIQNSFLNAIEDFNKTYAEKLTLGLYKEGIYSFGQLENTLLEFLPFICIVVLNLLVPEMFAYLIKFESYTPARVIIVTLLRTVLLRLASLAVLLTQMHGHIKSSENVCSLNNDDGSKSECWETYVGQQLYKLILTDFALQLVTTFFINLPRSFIAKHSSSRCLRIFGKQHFYLPKHVLDIVYIQTVIWIGSFFCPFLPIMGAFFYFLVFYIKKFTCLVNCTPSPVVYKTSKSKSMYMSVLLLSLIVSLVPIGYSIAELLPSLNCGPFRGLDSVWSYVIQTFEGFPYFIREAIFLLGTSTFAVPAFAVLLFFLYYYWAVATANRHMVTVLKNQLVLEGHDKQFLLNRLSAFIRQHQKRCERKKENRASFADEDSSIRQSSR